MTLTYSTHRPSRPLVDRSGPWCCAGCRTEFDGSVSEDEHVRRCKKAKHLLEQRRQLLLRREARDGDD